MSNVNLSIVEHTPFIFSTECFNSWNNNSINIYKPLSFIASGTTKMFPIFPVNNCLLIFQPTFTATTSFDSFEGLKTSIITRNITLTLPFLQRWNRLRG